MFRERRLREPSDVFIRGTRRAPRGIRDSGVRIRSVYDVVCVDENTRGVVRLGDVCIDASIRVRVVRRSGGDAFATRAVDV